MVYLRKLSVSQVDLQKAGNNKNHYFIPFIQCQINGGEMGETCSIQLERQVPSIFQL
jgi:hypothetical protein